MAKILLIHHPSDGSTRAASILEKKLEEHGHKVIKHSTKTLADAKQAYDFLVKPEHHCDMTIVTNLSALNTPQNGHGANGPVEEKIDALTFAKELATRKPLLIYDELPGDFRQKLHDALLRTQTFYLQSGKQTEKYFNDVVAVMAQPDKRHALLERRSATLPLGIESYHLGRALDAVQDTQRVRRQ